MDPTTTLATLRDSTADTADRRDAGTALLRWLRRGGYVPAGTFAPGESYGGHTAARRAAERIIARELSALPEPRREQYAVWYASAGCLPDGDGPEYVGTLAECEAYADGQRAERDSDPDYDPSGDLYDWSVDGWEDDSDDGPAVWHGPDRQSDLWAEGGY